MAQRTFKLRMWSKSVKRFYYDAGNVYDCLKQYHTPHLKEYYEDDMVWQEFTGFIDKNQTPIYEGDIVRDTFYGERTAKIVYDLGCFWLDSSHISQDLERELYDSTQDSLEVIGNIFENEI